MFSAVGGDGVPYSCGQLAYTESTRAIHFVPGSRFAVLPPSRVIIFRKPRGGLADSVPPPRAAVSPALESRIPLPTLLLPPPLPAHARVYRLGRGATTTSTNLDLSRFRFAVRAAVLILPASLATEYAYSHRSCPDVGLYNAAALRAASRETAFGRDGLYRVP